MSETAVPTDPPPPRIIPPPQVQLLTELLASSKRIEALLERLVPTAEKPATLLELFFEQVRLDRLANSSSSSR